MNRGLRLESVHRDYLRAAYELGELKDKNGVPPQEILELLDLSEEKGDRVLEFLVDAGMIVWPAKGELLLTESGLKKAEELAYEPRRLMIDPLRQDPGVSPSPAASPGPRPGAPAGGRGWWSSLIALRLREASFRGLHLI